MNITGIQDFAATGATQQSAAPGKVAQVQNVEPAAKPEQRKEPSAEELKEIVEKINDNLKTNGSDLRFQLDPDLKRPIVKVIDRATQDVLRQIPTVEMVELSKAIEKMQGVLFSKTA